MATTEAKGFGGTSGPIGTKAFKCGCILYTLLLFSRLLPYLLFFFFSTVTPSGYLREENHTLTCSQVRDNEKLASTSLSPETALIWETPLFVRRIWLRTILVKDITSNPTCPTSRKTELGTAKLKQKNWSFMGWMFMSYYIVFSLQLSYFLILK